MNSICAMLMIVSSIAGDDKKTTRWNFEDAAVGKLPESWSAAKTDKGNEWKIVEDKTAPKGLKVLAQTATAVPGSVFNVCVADKTNLADVDLSVRFKSVAGKKDQGGGLVWRCKDFSHYYVVRMNPLEENFRLYKFVDGKRIQLSTADVEAGGDKWHTLRVVHKGNHIQCWLNDKMLLEAKDDTIKDAGKVGVWTKADAQTYFDDLVLRKAE